MDIRGIDGIVRHDFEEQFCDGKGRGGLVGGEQMQGVLTPHVDGHGIDVALCQQHFWHANMAALQENEINKLLNVMEQNYGVEQNY